MTDEDYSKFCAEIFTCWLEEHKPYWELAKPAEYTLKATVAAFQLGVSMILEKYGY